MKWRVMAKLWVMLWGVCRLAVAAPITGASVAEAALERTEHWVFYDGSYERIAYPGGDVSPRRGVCSDVVIRTYRALGVDLQRSVHEDMAANFNLYPKNWGLKSTDTNIDHRRVPNLETFFARHGVRLPVSKNAKDYQPGDIVSWRLPKGLPHIGIVSPNKSRDRRRPLIVHNIGYGPKENDALFDYKIVGHFRFLPDVCAVNCVE